jgi:hypothetical protein
MGKVCNLCRVLETGISVVLAVMRSLGSSFDIELLWLTFMMINDDDYLYGISVFPLGGSATWVITWFITKFGFLLVINTY